MKDSLSLSEKKEFIEGLDVKEFKLVLKDHKPIPTMRPRKGMYSFYIPNDAKNRKLIHSIIIPQIPENILKNPLMSEIYLKAYFYFPIPKGFNQRDYQLAKEGYIKPIVKPDLDNVMKTYLDALNKLVWVDDSQVVEIYVKKCYTDKDEPYVVLKIGYIEDILIKKVAQSKQSSLVKINNKSILSQIEKLENQKAKYERALNRFKSEDTIAKYKDKIKGIDNEILSLKNKLIEVR